jgi:hypothetical protein
MGSVRIASPPAAAHLQRAAAPTAAAAACGSRRRLRLNLALVAKVEREARALDVLQVWTHQDLQPQGEHMVPDLQDFSTLSPASTLHDYHICLTRKRRGGKALMQHAVLSCMHA